MAFRKKTLQGMSPVACKIARLIGETNSINRRLKAVLPEIQDLEAKDMKRREAMHEVMQRLSSNPDAVHEKT